jgi:hypothetical protein
MDSFQLISWHEIIASLRVVFVVGEMARMMFH